MSVVWATISVYARIMTRVNNGGHVIVWVMEGGNSSEIEKGIEPTQPEISVTAESFQGAVDQDAADFVTRASNSDLIGALQAVDLSKIDATNLARVREMVNRIRSSGRTSHVKVAEEVKRVGLVLKAMEQKSDQPDPGLKRAALVGAGVATLAAAGIPSEAHAAQSRPPIYADISPDVLEQFEAFRQGKSQGLPFSPGPEGIRPEIRRQENNPPSKDQVIQKMAAGVEDQVYYTAEDIKAVNEYLESVGMESNAGKTINLLVRFSETNLPVNTLIDLAEKSQQSQLDFDKVSPALLFVQTYYGHASQELIDYAVSTNQHTELFNRLISFVGQENVDLQQYLSGWATGGGLRELGQFGVVVPPDMIDPTIAAEDLEFSNVGALLYYLGHERQWQPFSPVEINPSMINEFTAWKNNFIDDYFGQSVTSNNPNKEAARQQFEIAQKAITDYVEELYKQYPDHKRQPIAKVQLQPTPTATIPPEVAPSQIPTATPKPTISPEPTEVPPNSADQNPGKKRSLGGMIVAGLMALGGIGGGINHFRKSRPKNEDEYDN